MTDLPPFVYAVPQRGDGPVDPLLLAIEQLSFGSQQLAQRAMYGVHDGSYGMDELASDLSMSVAWVFRTACEDLTDNPGDAVKRAILEPLIGALETASEAIDKINEAAAKRWLDSQRGVS